MQKTIIVLIASLILLVGCKNETLPVDNNDRIEKQLNITEVEAYEIFMDKYSDSVVHKIEYKNFVYEVKGHKDDLEHEIKIDADSGEVIKEESEIEDNFYGELNVEDFEKIHTLIERSKEELSEEFVLYKWELEAEHVFTRFEIEFKSGKKKAEFKYDFESGELLKRDIG